MKMSLNKINGGYIGQSQYYDDVGMHSNIKNYNRYVSDSWVRPTEWLKLPDLTGITQALVGLLAIVPGFSSGHTGITSNSNFVTILARGAYNVNWGDGVTSAHSDNTTASKQYNYYSLPNENLTAEGYKQVIVTVTPQTGQNLTVLNLTNKAGSTGIIQSGLNYSGVTLPNGYPHTWLDLVVKGPNVSSITQLSGIQTTVQFPLLKSIEYVGRTNMTNSISMHRYLQNLESIGGEDWTENMTIPGGIFRDMPSLKRIPLIKTRNITSGADIFRSCPSLSTLPPIHTSTMTSMNNFCNPNYSLINVPKFNTSNVTSFISSFAACVNLRKYPELDFSSATDIGIVFNLMYSAFSSPDMSGVCLSARNTSQIFNANVSLQTFPNLNFSNFTGLFQPMRECTRINVMPDVQLLSTINTDGPFRNMSSCWKMGIISGGTGITNWANMFLNNNPILAGISAASGTLAGTTFPNQSTVIGYWPRSVRVAPAYNVGRSISYRATHLSPTALNEVFESLAPLVGVCATIDITDVWGSSGCNRQIAIDKGWTVVG